jgi:hypothetical protein
VLILLYYVPARSLCRGGVYGKHLHFPTLGGGFLMFLCFSPAMQQRLPHHIPPFLNLLLHVLLLTFF